LIRQARALVAPIAILAAVAALAIAQSWQRWLDPIIDVGRDLYIPEQLSHGAVLYRDLQYFYPPLTPYLLAAITFVTGSSLAAYTAIGIAVSLLTAALLYVIAGREAGFAAALLFLSCSMAGASTFGCNYIFPYSHAATIGTLFVLGTCAFALARKPVPAVLLAIAAAWTKIDFIIVGVAILGAAWIARRLSWRVLAAYAGGLAITAALLRAIFGTAFWSGVFPSALLGGANAQFFYRQVSGIANWRESAGRVVIAALLVAAFGAALALFDRGRWKWLLLVVIVLLAWPVADGGAFFRAWTLLQLALIPFAIRYRDSPLIVLLSFSLASIPRVFLNLTPDWYGFVCAVPLYALVAYVVFEWLPLRCVYSRRTSWFWFLPIGIVALLALRQQHIVWSLKAYPVATRRGTFYDIDPDRAAILNAALPELERTQTLAVIPEGLTLNYFAGVRTNLAVYIFTPAEIANEEIDRSVAEQLRVRHPERVAIVTRDMREFGSRGFGIDYGGRIAAVLRADYTVERRWDAPRFSLILLRR
jgi:hypothetical protein